MYCLWMKQSLFGWFTSMQHFKLDLCVCGGDGSGVQLLFEVAKFKEISENW